MELPGPVRSYVDRQVLRLSELAYLEFDHGACLRSWGGKTESYELYPEIGHAVDDVAPHLKDVLPLHGQCLILPDLQVRPHCFADVHLFSCDDSDWAVFLDTSEQTRSYQVTQQCFNELARLRELHQQVLDTGDRDPASVAEEFVRLTGETERLLCRQTRWVSSESYSYVLDELGVAVAQNMGDGQFRVEKSPSWFSRLLGEQGIGDIVDVVEVFPFLESFLEDAAVIWAGHLSGALRSGVWVENTDDGEEQALQATALLHEGDAILLFTFPFIEYREKQDILTRARTKELAHDRLRREIEKKEILLHCIIHDLSGPLHGIRGALDLLAMNELDDETRKLIELCQNQCETQGRLIQDILTAFSAEFASPGTMKLDADQAPDALEALHRVKAVLGTAFKMREVELEIVDRVGEKGSLLLAIDSNSLERSVINLTENALRHSPKGSTVRLGIEAAEQDLVITVDDEGRGVPKKLQGVLFEKFAQGGDRASRGKIGLGLYFCRMTAETWGGSVGQENRSAGGARFWIRLPRLGLTGENQKY